jgi:hypothetical protein
MDHVLYDFSGKGLKILQGGYVTLLVEIKLPVHHLKAFLGLGKILLWLLQKLRISM